MATWRLGWHVTVMINYLYSHCQTDPVLKAVCNHLHGAIRESRQTSAQAASVAIASQRHMILDASAFQDCRPLRATLLFTPFVGSSLFGGQYQSSVEEATRSQEKLSQVRRLASVCSRAAQGTSGSRVPQQSQKRRTVPPPLLPLQPLSHFLQGMEVWLPKGACQKTGVTTECLVGPLLSLRLSRALGGRGLQHEASSQPPLIARPHHFLLSHPLWGGGGWVDGSTVLDIPGLVWDTQHGIAQKGLFPVSVRQSFFLPAWQRITSEQEVSWR